MLFSHSFHSVIIVCVYFREPHCVDFSTSCVFFIIPLLLVYATHRHCLHVCVAPMLVLHPRLAIRVWLHMPHAEGWNGTKILADEQNGKHNQQRRTHWRRRANIFNENRKKCTSKDSSGCSCSVFIVLLPSTLHSVHWDHSWRLELGNFSLSHLKSKSTIITRKILTIWRKSRIFYLINSSGFAWRIKSHSVLFNVRGWIENTKKRSLLSRLQSK